MADNLLANIVAKKKNDDKHAKKQIDLLGKIYDTQKELLDVEKDRLKEEKRKARNEKQDRKKQEADYRKKRSPAAALSAGDEKEKKGFLGSLLKGFKGLFSTAGLMKAGLLTALVGGITAVFKNKKLREAIGEALFGAKGFFGEENRKKLFSSIKDFLFGEKGIFSSFEKFGVALGALTLLLGPKKMLGLVGSILSIGTSIVSKVLVPILKQAPKLVTGIGKLVTSMPGIVKGFTAILALPAVKAALGLVGAPIALAAGAGAAAKGVIKQNYGGGTAGDLGYEMYEEGMGINRKTKNARGRTTKENTQEDKDRLREIQSARRQLRQAQKMYEREVEASKSVKIDARGRRTVKITDQDRLDKATAVWEKRQQELYDQMYGKMQRGGFVGTVPHQGGNGDRFRTMLEPGSIVLNQTAAGMMQTGGMVPTMLEQGEKVFSPRDPMAGFALAMNEMIPRFQQGGMVHHSNTGSGYSPLGQKDYKGRPVVFSKEGAKAWEEMVKASNGLMKGKDVTSSQRSPSYNAAVGGVSNSNHLYGNAVDVNTGSSTWHWLKNNDGKYGWKFNNYLGPQGWHWDFLETTGKKAKKDGNEKGIAKQIDSQVNSAGDIISTMMGSVGGTALTELLGSMGAGVKELFSQVVGALGFGSPAFAKATTGFGAGATGFGAGATGFGAGGGMRQAKGAIPANSLYKSMGFNESQWDTFRNTVAQIESGGKYNISGGSGNHYDGRYQLGAAAKTDAARYAGVSDPGHNAASRAAFRMNPQLQEQMFAGFTKANYTYLMRNSAFANASKERQLQILGYAHNQGMGGAEKWMNTGVVGSDGFGTKGTAYTDAIASEFKKQRTMQMGGVANMKGAGAYSAGMVTRSQEQFAEMIADKARPIIVPMSSGGGGGGTSVISPPGTQTAPPSLSTDDVSVVAMEYKYRITMGSAV